MTATLSSSYVPAIVIGGGLSGLVCGHTLKQRGIEAHVFEVSDRAGGVIQSEQRDGFLFELGPQSFAFTDSLRLLCRELRIESQMQLAPGKLPRYLLIGGELVAAPMSPPAFFLSPMFSAKTKWSVIRDLFGNTRPPVSPAAGDESVAGFVRRKFTAELLEKLVGPFISGIYAGDPEKLGLRSAFPQVWEAENARGSVVRGLLRARKSGTGPRTLGTFAGGNQVLTDALANSLGTQLHRSIKITRVLPALPRAPGRFTVEFSAVDDPTAISTMLHTDHLIMATPASAAGTLLKELDADFVPMCEAIYYVPMAVVSLGYRRAAVKNSLRGFGFLAPRNAGLRVLGCVWNSSLFPQCAPEDSVLLTSFVGGAFDPGAAQLSPQEVQNVVHQELRRVLGISETPVIGNVHAWQQAIPQYDLRHFLRVIAFSQKIAGIPGLAFAGNYSDGPSIGSVVDRARKVADYVLDGPVR
ncbi:MAG TPA: protoporphyrinogen oxidase [Candidatus Dormibacteraeota bacterium]|nr:protoporphyrinogen oxidase [Candidatus Dormibacteraeota bacterium]